MFNNVSITKDGKKDIIDISGKRFNQVTELSETDLARLLKINSELFQFYTNWYLLHGKLFYFKTDFIYAFILNTKPTENSKAPSKFSSCFLQKLPSDKTICFR